VTQTATPARTTTVTAAAPAARLLERLVDELSAGGALEDSWRAAFLAVPRHLFVPDLVWRSSPDGRRADPVNRTAQPAEWWELVYRDEAVITQLADGAPPAGAATETVSGVEFTSSTSMPTVVAEMLVAVRAQPGMRVLEIGTGTGWNAALLAYRLGPGNVTSVEIDPVISAHAREALAAAGYGAVRVVTGDGTRGHQPGAPFDRVLFTACVYQVPYA